MDRDGTSDGYDLALTRAVADAVAVPVIASGGAGELEHLAEGISSGGADAVLAASIFHYGRYTIAEAKRAMREAGIEVTAGGTPAPPAERSRLGAGASAGRLRRLRGTAQKCVIVPQRVALERPTPGRPEIEDG